MPQDFLQVCPSCIVWTTQLSLGKAGELQLMLQKLIVNDKHHAAELWLASCNQPIQSCVHGLTVYIQYIHLGTSFGHIKEHVVGKISLSNIEMWNSCVWGVSQLVHILVWKLNKLNMRRPARIDRGGTSFIDNEDRYGQVTERIFQVGPWELKWSKSINVQKRVPSKISYTLSYYSLPPLQKE